MAHKILRLDTVLNIRGRSRSSHYKDIQDGLFPPPIKIGLRAVGWTEYETEAINAARIAGKTDDEIRELVKKLLIERTVALRGLNS